jgi:phage gp45-like
VDDSKMMQETLGNFMANEARSAIEAPQNYGFTSVVRKAVKDAQGKITSSAEGFVSFMGGNRSFPVMGIMDDRRYRPMGMKEGENGQYDDLGQMTLIRRTGLYLLSLDSPDDSQQQSSSSSSSSAQQTAASSGSSGQGQTVQRFVSVRHVEKQKQQRPQQSSGSQSGGGTSSQSGSQQDFQHEGQSVNNEMRVSKARIEFRTGTTVVGYYDKASATWCFIGKVKLGTESAKNPVYGVNGGVGMTSDPNGSDAVMINAPKPGPPTSQDNQPLVAIFDRLDVLERRVTELEGRA